MRDFDQAYITERDCYVMEQWNRGVDADTIADVVGLNSAEEARATFIEADRKLTALLSFYEDKSSELTIYNFLEEIGITRNMLGVKELMAAIQLAMNQPDLINQMGGKFFPALGKELDMAPRTVHAHMVETLNRVYKERILSGLDVTFFEQLGKYGMYRLRIRSFLESALNRINYIYERRSV